MNVRRKQVNCAVVRAVPVRKHAGGVEVQVHSFLTSVSGQLHAPATLPQGSNLQVPISWEAE